MNRRIVAALSLLAVSCVTRDTAPLSKLAEGCLLNSDCETPLVCVFRRCHQPCVDRRDCPADQDCQLAGDPPELVCTLTETTCADVPCPRGQICGADRRCRFQCAGPADCAARQACVEGQCVWNDQLQPDGGFPRPLGGPACEYSSQCALGQRCSRSGQCVAECLGSSDCAVTASCLGGRCIPNQTTSDAGVPMQAPTQTRGARPTLAAPTRDARRVAATTPASATPAPSARAAGCVCPSASRAVIAR